MNNRIILFGLCLMTFSLNAQYDGQGEDEISRFRPGFMWFYTGVRPAKTEKTRKYDRLIFDLTYNDWTGDNNPFENRGPSIGLNTNLIFDIPLTKGNTVSIGIGVAHQYINIRHDNKFLVDDFAKTTVYSPKDSFDVFRKSTLSGNNFSIPIELRFHKESWKHFKIHLGGKIGYQANLLSKQVSNINGHRVLNKRFGFPDENKLTYSAHVRLGFRNFALFGSYNFNTLFSNKSSTQLNLLQMGLSISLY
ncbi:MAG TPA: hypothetical protein EYG86_07580 [Crocinitomicaceae bacterium]|nr:hypothetical protein [Crocinitomicaceae bacterium]